MAGTDPRPRASGAQYDLLPTTEKGINFPFGSTRFGLKRRRNIVLSSLLIGTSVLVFLYLLYNRPAPGSLEAVLEETDQPLPPLYSEYHQAELALPHHDRKHPFANGKKYMWVSDHVQSSGFGNFMQDMIMNAELVYRTRRTIVFDNFTWDRDGGDYAQFNGKVIPSRIPLSALISGPIVGGPYEHDEVPRSVVKEYWDEICPNKTIVRADEMRKLHGEGATAEHIMDVWVDYINKIDDPCVEVERHSGSIFHIFMFGTPHEILPSWPKLSRSPILRLFGWGTLAHSGFEANRHLFSPAPLIEEYSATPTCPHCVDPYGPLPGLLAVHVRRGDFLQHCENLGHWGAGFNAFNSFPSFPDPWVPPQGTDEERMAVYLRRCLPTTEQLVEKIESVRRAPGSEGLKNLYIMTNGDKEWAAEVRAGLMKAFKWEHIATSRDMVLTPEQKYTSHTMDMLIGERAQVFIGNGFSSMTSNIAMLRMARERPPSTTHML